MNKEKDVLLRAIDKTDIGLHACLHHNVNYVSKRDHGTTSRSIGRSVALPCTERSENVVSYQRVFAYEFDGSSFDLLDLSRNLRLNRSVFPCS